MIELKPEKTVTAYRITIPEAGGGWCYAGITPSEVAEAIKNEVEMNESLSAEECGTLVISAYETTQTEIDALPEFQGW